MEDAEHESKKTGKKNLTNISLILVLIVAAAVIFNQWQIYTIAGNGITKTITGRTSLSGEKDLTNIDLSSIKSTGHAIAAVFPVEDITDAQSVVDMMLPTGTPEYGREMGVSFDDPTGSLSILAKSQRALLAGLTPEQKERFLNLASKPVGISCEYCCGVGPVGIKKDGSSACGCQHNPALLSVTMWLIQNRPEYSDAEILREVLKWKTLFFPKKMIELGLTVAGGDTTKLDSLPGMVGGC